MAGVVVAVGEDCDLMYGSEVWGIVQGAYAQDALATCSLTTLKPFSLSLGEAGTIPIVGGTSLQCLQEAGAPWTSKPTVVVMAGQGGTGFIGVQLAKALGAGTVITAATGDGIVFVKGLGAVSSWTTMCRTSSIPWAMTPWTSSSTTWVSQACGNCRGRSGSLSGIRQIVTSAVRIL